MKIVIYQKPTCTTCRQVYAVLKESGVPLESVDYYLEPLSKDKLRDLLRKMGMKARDLMRTKEAIYRKLALGDKELSEEQLLTLSERTNCKS